eukprot:TRINITY_DN13575_c0_g1_i1.p1 TRINITY_DN13575_c0_g1~~TRINITY_DN13575_c0_g1_i1.p1  ORF type:complete len:449 (+),score=127.91 TRINITY_DN13575_c0_g1_i1:46-1392(+)
MEGNIFELSQKEVEFLRAAGIPTETFVGLLQPLVNFRVGVLTRDLQSQRLAIESERVSLQRKAEEVEARSRMVESQIAAIQQVMEERALYEQTIRDLREALNRLDGSRAAVNPTLTLPQTPQRINDLRLKEECDRLRRENEMLRLENETLIKLLDERSGIVKPSSAQQTPPRKESEAKDTTELKLHLSALRRGIVQTSAVSAEAEAQRFVYENTIEELNARLQLAQARINEANTALTSQRSYQQRLEAELSTANNHLRTSEAHSRNLLDDLRREKERLLFEVQELKEEAVRFLGEKSLFETQIRQLKAISEAQKEEMTSLYELLATRKGQVDAVLAEISTLRTENAALHEELSLLRGEVKARREAEALLAAENLELSRAKDYYIAQNERVTAEFGHKSKEFSDKLGELFNLKQLYDKGLSEAVNVLERTAETATRSASNAKGRLEAAT